MNLILRNRIALLTVLFIFALSTSVIADSFTINASASPKKGGTISPSGKVTVESGEDMRFTLTPNTGYEIKDVVVDRVSQGAIDNYIFPNITQKHSIRAKFAVKTFTVTIAQGGKVRVSPVGKRTVKYGKGLKLQIKPESEDIVPILLVNGKQVDAMKSGSTYRYVLTPTGDTSIFATSAIEPKLAPSTKIMDESTAQNLSSISEDGTVYTFFGITPYLESLQPGDVMMSTIPTDLTPYGLLRKVTNVAIDGSQVTVKTSQATLEDVIEKGNIIINKSITKEDIVSFVPLREGVALQEPLPGPLAEWCKGIPILVLGKDGPNEIKLNGEICLDPSVTFAMEWDWFELEYLDFSTGLSERISLDIVADGYLRFASEPIPIASITLVPIPAGPVVIFPILDFYVIAQGYVNGGITAGVTQAGSLGFGISY